ncbi:MAG: hypothetical protein WCJ75_14635 [Desulfomonile sp.]
MTRLIRLSDRDTETLAKIRKLGPTVFQAQPHSYDNVVVVKPWGYEFLVYQNDQVAIWFLHLEKEHATSMHCHPKKKTALIVLSGQALCNTFFKRNYLAGVDGAVIEAGVFHSTRALSEGGADVIEIETPVDKADLVRLDDRYGRSRKGYEGLSEMKTEQLEQYGFFACAEPQNGYIHVHRTRNYEIALRHFPECLTFGELMRRERGELYCVCRGAISNGARTAIIGPGDLADCSFLETFDDALIDANTILFRSQSLRE